MTTTSRLARCRPSKAWGTPRRCRSRPQPWLHCGGIHLPAGLRPARPGDGLLAGEVVEPAQGHLGAAGIVNAQDSTTGVSSPALPSTRTKALSRCLAKRSPIRGRKVTTVALLANRSQLVQRNSSMVSAPRASLELLCQASCRGLDHGAVLLGNGTDVRHGTPIAQETRRAVRDDGSPVRERVLFSLLTLTSPRSAAARTCSRGLGS